MSREICVTEADKQELKKIIDDVIDYKNTEYKELDAKLAHAEVVGIDQLPADVITMNSKILLLQDGIEEEISLVYPHESDISKNMVSVLSPVGMTVLGYREGDTVECRVPSGIIKVEVKKVLYQPESAGNIV